MITRRGRLTLSMRRALIILPLWVLCGIWMWMWWLEPSRVDTASLYFPLTSALLYEFAILPSIFLYFVLKAKIPKKKMPLKNKKVAVISLCVPSSESLDIVENQLRAMSEITYPHDSWILDEGNDPEIKKLAKQYGVKHFSRKGIRKYNRPSAPFQKKTKAGNVNAWLDRVKWRRYDYFVQLDIDHIPQPNYLNKTLGYFKDEKVAWVQAPSVYKNLTSWISRGSAEQELVLQGPLQMGFYGYSETPFIIGSHCTYNMKAVREIGGFQPTRAEDHLDTVLLSSKGYKGVFLPEIIAQGDGPETLSTYLAQQFAWAYSMFQVLTQHSPKLLRTMSWKRRLQFLFAQTWYPLWSLAYMIMFITPVVALITKQEVASMQPEDFGIHILPVFLCSFLIWWAARPIMQPQTVGLSWRGMILHAVRWPIILRAIVSVVFKIKKPYMITPKGSFAHQAPTINTYKPFLILGLINCLAILYATAVYGINTPAGQIVFALSNACFMLIICLVDIDLRLRQSSKSVLELNRHWYTPVAAVMALVILTAISAISSPLATDQLAKAISGPVQNPQTTKNVDQMNIAELKQALQSQPAWPSNKAMPSLGVYSPDQRAVSNQAFIEHSFVDWDDTEILARQIVKTQKSGNISLITLEPRTDETGDILLEKIANGSYDSKLKEISEILATSNQPVYVRFAHEMELAELYPWGAQEPSNYISAYRHFVDYARLNNAKNVRWVWSPAGNNGSEAYYPGDDVVDVIGTTILYDQYWYGYYEPSFYELASTRFSLQYFGKPVWIVELGVGNANKTYQQSLIRDSLALHKEYGYDAVVYLNIADSNIEGPDYRLDNTSILFNSISTH